MRKSYKIITSVRLLSTALILTLSVSQAKAEERKYYWFVTDAMAYPTGGGTVYIADQETEEIDRTYTSEMEIKNVGNLYGNSMYFYGYSKPANGYMFVGWKTLNATYYDDIEDNPNIKIKDYLSDDFVSYNQDDNFYLSTAVVSGNTDTEYYSFIPDNTLVAMFGHIALRYVPGQADLGTIEVEDPSAEIGDITNIIATPNADVNATFLYWLNDSGVVVSTSAEYATEITRNITYTAVFAAPGYETIDFGKDGGYKLISDLDHDIDYEYGSASHVYITPEIWSSITYTLRTDTVYGTKTIEVDTIINGVDTFANVIVPDTQYIRTDTTTSYLTYDNSFHGNEYITNVNEYSYGFNAGTATLVHGTGLVTFHHTEKDTNSTPFTQGNLVAAGSNGTDISTLAQDTAKYYLFDEKTNTFNAVTSGVVPAGSGYLVITKDMPEYKYDTLYFVTEEEYNASHPNMDVNNDGSIDTDDVLTIYNAIQTNVTDGMDVNNDGQVDTQDVLSVYEYIRAN